jgi:hypothetical protein
MFYTICWYVGLLNGSLLFSIQQEAEYRLCIPPNYYILRTLHDCHICIPENGKLKIDTVIQKIHNLFQKSFRGKGNGHDVSQPFFIKQC